MNDEIELGQRVRNKVDGFAGIVVCRSEWLWGCVRYEVQPEGLDKDGLPLDAQWLDQGQLEVLAEPLAGWKSPAAPEGIPMTGGPARATGTPSDPPSRPSGGP
jgi:hypothetical protein